MQFIKIGSCLLLLGVSNQLFGATEYEDSVPLELVRVLLGNPTLNGEVRVYSDVLDQFPTLDYSDQFEVMGSVDHGYSQRVVLKTGLESETATASLQDDLERQGFIPFVQPYDVELNRGFVVQQQVQRPTQMCRDDVGNMSISVSQMDDDTIFVLAVSQLNNMQSQSCEQKLEEQNQNYVMMQNMRNRGRPNLRQYLPRMVVPTTDFRQRRVFGGGGSSSSSGNTLETEYELNIDWSISEVYQHFADQISEQGWDLDSETIGEITANADWISSPEPSIDLVGNLNILRAGEGSYQLKFRLVSVGDQPAASAQPYTPFRVQN